MTIRWKSTTSSYGWLSMSLHWLMLILIVLTYATIDLKSVFPRESAARDLIVTCHYMLGLTVFCFVWLRLWARSAGAVPIIEPGMTTSQARLSKAVHVALYALMIALPILGWLFLSARGKPVVLLGMELPILIDKNQGVAKLLRSVHTNIATAGYFLIGLHAAAGIYHHYVKRDNILKLMLPR